MSDVSPATEHERWREASRGSAAGPFVEGLRLLLRDRAAVVGLLIIGFFAAISMFAGLIIPYEPFETVYIGDGSLGSLLRPSEEFLLGTTSQAKDVFSQLVLGTRVAFIVGTIAAVVVGILSVVLGLVSGYFGGFVDDFIMRATDFALSIPTLPIAIVAVAIAGPSLRNIIIIISLLFWRNGARIVRSVVLSEKEKAYVVAARSTGASHWYILRRHILPNVIPVGFLWMTMSVAFAILTEASLSFLGLGDPNSISWGQMLNLAFASGAIRTAWWWVVPPSLCLVVLVSSIYIVGRAWEEKTNPQLRER